MRSYNIIEEALLYLFIWSENMDQPEARFVVDSLHGIGTVYYVF
jgi:hypothetical protein